MHLQLKRTIWRPIVLIVLAALMLIFLGVIGRSSAPLVQVPTSPGEETVEGRVLAVLQESDDDLNGVQQHYQKLWVIILNGNRAGRAVNIDTAAQGFAAADAAYRVDDEVQIGHFVRPDGSDVYVITDPIRLGTLAALLVIFVVLIVVVSHWQGLRSLAGMAISLYVITQFILPMILAGHNPVFITIVGAFASLAITQYLIYGWSTKSHAAILGILISLILTGILASIFVAAARLTGFGSEEVGFLQSVGVSINPRGLLLAGILIGALGVLDDVTISQASAVWELSAANPALGIRELYRRAMNIGRDHIASTVNTLVLAYVGASLPLLLLFAIYPQPFGQLINREFVAEEIVQTLVGSLGLVAAVPITTLLAGLFTQRSRTAQVSEVQSD